MDADFLRSIATYDPDTGVFRWRVNRGSTARAGDVFGTRMMHGHLKVGINYREHLLHRLAWLYVHGRWPDGEIDHIDGDPSNNRLANLRDVPHAVNCENHRSPKVTSTTKMLGVSPVSKCPGLWRARIQVRGKPMYLGCFATKEEAHAVYVMAKRELHEGNTL